MPYPAGIGTTGGAGPYHTNPAHTLLIHYRWVQQLLGVVVMVVLPVPWTISLLPVPLLHHTVLSLEGLCNTRGQSSQKRSTVTVSYAPPSAQQPANSVAFYHSKINLWQLKAHAGCCAVVSCAVLFLQVVAVLTELQKRKPFQGLPLYAVGASSGGAFALTITAYLRFSGGAPLVS